MMQSGDEVMCDSLEGGAEEDTDRHRRRQGGREAGRQAGREAGRQGGMDEVNLRVHSSPLAV